MASNFSEMDGTGEDLDKKYEDFYHTAQFITGLICYPVLCILGLTGNILSLIVLNQKKMLTSTNVILTALAVADLIKLLNDALYFLVLILLRTHPEAGNRMMGYMYPVSHYIFNQAVCITAWLTVSVAVERYISVCHATRAKMICTVERARIVSILVFILMSLLAVPSALRYTKITVYDNTTNTSYYEIAPSALGNNRQFMTAYIWLQNLLRSLIPLFVLIILNTCIIHSLRKQRVKGKKMSARNRITLMLITIVVVFLICITPDAIMSTFFGYGYVEANNLVKGVREFTDMLLAVNSAVNFVIYCAFSKVFRDTFISIFCKKYAESRKRRKRDANKERLLPTNAERSRRRSDYENGNSPSMTRIDCQVELPQQTMAVINGNAISKEDGDQTYV